MLIHGDEGHSCYSKDGELTCVVAKILLSNGPDWRALADTPPRLTPQLTWEHGHERVWDTFTEKWWCVCEQWTSDSMETFEQHADST